MKALSTQSTKIVTALVAGFLAIVLAACGGGGGSGDTGGGASAPVEKPAITTQPANQSVATGNTATFSVVATGSATLAYQWKKNGADISGATSSSYTTPATSSADNGHHFFSQRQQQRWHCHQQPSNPHGDRYARGTQHWHPASQPIRCSRQHRYFYGGCQG